MDEVSRIAIELARQVAPDEIHEAALIAETFAKGGKARKELLKPGKNGGLGGFGLPGDGSVLALIFQVLTTASPYLVGFLAAKSFDNAGPITKTIQSMLQGRRVASPNQAPAVSRHATPAELTQMHIEGTSARLKQIVDIMAQALQKAGLAEEESLAIAYKVVLVLWEDAPGAIVLLHKITERR